MSLNGLDEGAINEAYQAALAEAGGWLLIQYTSRDSVELLSRGNGGVVEVRNTIEQYTEKSPLYGLVQYRRRKVVLKYIPEGTSRLLQARVTVHFQGVLEKFTPHDTTFSITAPTDITETALSSACMLHTSGSFTSSSSSLRRKRLDEIAEDAEDVATERGTPQKSESRSIKPDEEKSGEKTPTRTLPGRGDMIPTVAISAPSLPSSPLRKIREGSTVPEPMPQAKFEQENSNKPLNNIIPSNTLVEEPRQDDHDGNHDDGESYRQYLQQLSRPSYEPRRSTQSARPSAFDIEKASIYSGYSNYRGKLKRGPRPSLDQYGRPKTSGYSQVRNGEPRPVSTLPSGVRFSSRPVSHISQASQITQKPRSPSSAASTTTTTPSADHSTADHSVTLGSTTSVQANIPQINDQIPSFYRPPLFAPMSSQNVPLVSKSPGMTPEKERLMRALQLRKKQLAQHQRDREERETSTPDNVTADVEQLNGDVLKKSRASNPSSLTNTELLQNENQNLQDSEVSLESDQVGSPSSNGNTSDTVSSKRSSFTEAADHVEDDQGSRGLGLTDKASEAVEASPIQQVKDEKRLEELHPLSTGPIEPFNPIDIRLIEVAPNSEQAASLQPDTERDSIKTHVSLVEPQDATISGTSTTMDERANSLSRSSSRRRVSSSPPGDSPRSTRKPNLLIQINQSPRNSLSETRPRAKENSRLSSTERLARRQGVIDPLKDSPVSDTSDISDDDALMEELQSAKLEEAKPITVARSPATPIFPKGSPDLHRPSLTDIKASVSPKKMLRPSVTERSSSSPPRPPSKSSLPSDTPPSKPHVLRSASGRTLPQWPPVESTPPQLTKKVSVSTGISKRIKALEIFSGRDSSTSPPQTQASSAISTPSKLFKGRMSWTPNRHAPNMTTATPPPSRFPSSTPGPTPEQASSGPNCLPNEPSQRPSSPKKARESIQVTARIIRDSSQSKSSTRDELSDPASLNLYRSPLIVQREKSEPEAISHTHDETALLKKAATHQERSKNEKHRQSKTPILSPKRPSTEIVSSRLSFSSLGRPKTSEISVARSASETSSLYNGEEREKKESRRSRIMRRMSNLTSGSRRSAVSALSPSSTSRDESLTPTIQESAEILPTPEPEVRRQLLPQHVVDIGDVNVQFPDTLLWKRRFMRVDDQGYLILTPPTMEKNTRNISRRFHLSEIRKPVIPDLDRQELPHSIVLDFEDGSCLQCACESRYAQGQVFRMLLDAHAAYNQVYN